MPFPKIVKCDFILPRQMWHLELPKALGDSFLSAQWKAMERSGSDDLVRSLPALSLVHIIYRMVELEESWVYLRKPSHFTELGVQDTCPDSHSRWWEDKTLDLAWGKTAQHGDWEATPLPQPGGRGGGRKAGEAAISACCQKAARSCDPQEWPVHVWLLSKYKSTVLGFWLTSPRVWSLKAFVTLWGLAMARGKH